MFLLVKSKSFVSFTSSVIFKIGSDIFLPAYSAKATAATKDIAITDKKPIIILFKGFLNSSTGTENPTDQFDDGILLLVNIFSLLS